MITARMEELSMYSMYDERARQAIENRPGFTRLRDYRDRARENGDFNHETHFCLFRNFVKQHSCCFITAEFARSPDGHVNASFVLPRHDSRGPILFDKTHNRATFVLCSL